MSTDPAPSMKNGMIDEYRALIAQAVELYDAIKTAFMREAWESGMTFDEACAELDTLEIRVKALAELWTHDEGRA